MEAYRGRAASGPWKVKRNLKLCLKREKGSGD